MKTMHKMHKLLFAMAIVITAFTMKATAQSTLSQDGTPPLGTISAKSPICGAKGDGIADDTVALQKCISYAYQYNLALYLPATTNTSVACPNGYLVKGPLDATTEQIYSYSNGAFSPSTPPTTYPPPFQMTYPNTGLNGAGFWMVGDGQYTSTICHDFTLAYPVLDFGGDTAGGIRDIGIVPVITYVTNNGKTLPVQAAGNSSATAGVVVSNGYGNGTTAGGSNQAGGSFQILNDYIWAGSTPSTAAVVVVNSDLVKISGSRINGGSPTANYPWGGGLVMGGGLGLASKASAFYTAISTGSNPTLYYLDNNLIGGDLAPAIQFTGSNEYHFDGSYVALLGTGGAAAIIVVGQSSCSGNCADALTGSGLRTENQSSATQVPAIQFATTSYAGNITGSFNTDYNYTTGVGGAAITCLSGANLGQYFIDTNGQDAYGIECPGSVFNSDLRLGGDGSFGYIGLTGVGGQQTGANVSDLDIVWSSLAQTSATTVFTTGLPSTASGIHIRANYNNLVFSDLYTDLFSKTDLISSRRTR